MFIDGWTAVEPIRTKHQIDCLQQRGFSNVIVAYQDGVCREQNLRMLYTAEVFFGLFRF